MPIPRCEAEDQPQLTAQRYARYLLDTMGNDAPIRQGPELHPAQRWAQSGLMSLTGEAGDEPQMCPAPIAACADGALLALQALASPKSQIAELQGAELLTERAALMDLSRNGRIAPGGSCRMLDAADGRIAINLARADDWSLLPAWCESGRLNGETGDWQALTEVIAALPVKQLVERGRMLGLALAEDALPGTPAVWFEVTTEGPRAIRGQQPVVLDLSSLWAGPLCSHLLQQLGARVIKVESTTRPDGARRGNADFYNLLNGGKASVALDLETDAGRQHLRELIKQADIVIEGSRPRGLRQMGIVAEEIVRTQPGLTWLSITGHGREGVAGESVGFGDDAAVAGGLSQLMRLATGQSLFVGDAIADPLTGMHAALAAWQAFQAGGGRLISLALRDVVTHCLQFDLPVGLDALRARQRDWSSVAREVEAGLPRSRRPRALASGLGDDTYEILK